MTHFFNFSMNIPPISLNEMLEERYLTTLHGLKYGSITFELLEDYSIVTRKDVFRGWSTRNELEEMSYFYSLPIQIEENSYISW